jgi:hypothetical protein
MRPARMPVATLHLGSSVHQTDGQELVGRQGIGERKVGSYVQRPRLLSLPGKIEDVDGSISSSRQLREGAIDWHIAQPF